MLLSSFYLCYFYIPRILYDENDIFQLIKVYFIVSKILKIIMI